MQVIKVALTRWESLFLCNWTWKINAHYQLKWFIVSLVASQNSLNPFLSFVSFMFLPLPIHFTEFFKTKIIIYLINHCSFIFCMAFSFTKKTSSNCRLWPAWVCHFFLYATKIHFTQLRDVLFLKKKCTLRFSKCSTFLFIEFTIDNATNTHPND